MRVTMGADCNLYNTPYCKWSSEAYSIVDRMGVFRREI